MHAEELRRAINRVVEVLNKADILAVIKQYRAAKGDQRAVAAARLGHSGAVIMENMDKFSATEREVATQMHLQSLGTTTYWQQLLGTAGDPVNNAAEIVHLYSRIMFATSHLPNLVKLIDEDGSEPVSMSSIGSPTAEGEGRLVIRLADAGERACDPDRVARSVDGIDMLYSACASIARKPAMDLRLEGVNGDEHRDVHFTGERDSVSAVSAVIESIPEALEHVGADDDLDLDSLVSSLPIFEDLTTLANLGTFTENDLKDISETMHQGVMLVLESGVILMNDTESTRPRAAPKSRQVDPDMPTLARRNASTVKSTATAGPQDAADTDEHYANYLREREAMQKGSANLAKGTAGTAVKLDANREAGQATVPSEAAADELLKNLSRARDS